MCRDINKLIHEIFQQQLHYISPSPSTIQLCTARDLSNNHLKQYYEITQPTLVKISYFCHSNIIYVNVHVIITDNGSLNSVFTQPYTYICTSVAHEGNSIQYFVEI